MPMPMLMPMLMPMPMPMSIYMSMHMPMSMSMPMSMLMPIPVPMYVSVSVSGHGILADYLLGQGEPSTCFTGLAMFQSTPSAKTKWRQENGYSQQVLSLHRPVLPPSLPRHDQKGRRPTCSILFSLNQCISPSFSVAISILAAWLARPTCLPPPL